MQNLSINKAFKHFTALTQEPSRDILVKDVAATLYRQLERR